MLQNATPISLDRVTFTAFPGLDLRAKPASGACAAMQNGFGGDYPVLSSRPARGLVTTLAAPGGVLQKDALLYVDGSALVISGYSIDLGLTAGEKQLCSMGAYVVIFPDKKYLNTQNFSDFGALEHQTSTTTSVSFSLCSRDGTAYQYVTAAPEDPGEGTLWLDVGNAVLRRYSAASGWQEVSDCCVSVSSTGIGLGFEAGDGVTLSGAGALDGNKVLALSEANRIVVPGAAVPAVQETAVTVARAVPDLDYVVECGNRLWGCKYGLVDGKPVNELYCCKLGDFKNWACYEGLSTDSWAASRGADGAFTGAAVLSSSPIFFRETCLERIYPAAGGAHQVTVLPCAGVQKGCARSLALLGGKLYYQSPSGVCCYDGALPQSVGDRLNGLRCISAAAGALGGDYYLSLQTGEDAYRLFQLDTARGNWYEQDGLPVLSFASGGWDLFALCSDGRLYSMTGDQGETEGPVGWSLETGELGLDRTESQYLAKLRLRCRLSGTMSLSLQYDSDGVWHPAGSLSSLGLQSFTLPLLPRRCDHVRLRLQGEGSFRLYSLSQLLGKGSDQT